MNVITRPILFISFLFTNYERPQFSLFFAPIDQDPISGIEKKGAKKENMGLVDGGSPRRAPQLDMQFGSEPEAYAFYNEYAASMGFSVRRSKMWTTSKDVLAARSFVCSKQGFRQKKKGFEPKKPRPATRTGCPACMTIKITPTGRYRVADFVQSHNHQLANPSTSHTLRSHRPKVRARLPDVMDSSPSPETPSPLPARDLRFRKSMMQGDAGAVLEHLQAMQVENSCFYYAVRVDDERDSMTNFFWVDAKSVMDYMCFGDVVCFDTTYRTADHGRPLALFLGSNNHKQVVIFGSALLYDESADSFVWLFETFNKAMRGKQPSTLLTDRCEQISQAVASVWPGTAHRFCIWQLFQNATKQLNQVFEGSKTFAYEFGQCVFDYEEEDDFVLAWETLIDKYDLKDNEWLDSQFKDRECWALPYGREVFCADMKSTMRKENLNSVLKKFVNPKLNMLQFLQQYGKFLEEKRSAEMQADFYACQRIQRMPSFRMLKQAANVYTPAIFKDFEKEFELHMDCMVFHCGEVGTVLEYKVTVEEKPKEHYVRFDLSNGTVLCSCRKFELVGIQCRHVFKVLDFRNIKELPSQYILTRWRKDARIGTIRYSSIYASLHDPKSSLINRYNYLFCILNMIAARAVKTTESYHFIQGQSSLLSEQLEQLFRKRPFQIPYFNIGSNNQQRDVMESLSDSLQHDSNTEASFVGSATNGILGF